MKAFHPFSDSLLTKYEAIVLEAHDTIEDVISGILNDDEDEDEIMDTNEETEEEEISKTDPCLETTE